MRSITTIILAGVFGLSTTAFAADTCPEDPDSYIQYGPESAEEDVACPCTPKDIGATWIMVCDLEPGSAATSAGGWITAIYDPGYSGGGAVCGGSEYCAWGEMPDTAGSFYCEWDHTKTFDSTSHNLVRVNVLASAQPDAITFQYDTYDLDTWGASVTLNASAKGRAEDDKIFGSRVTGGYYLETLRGDENDDLLCSYDGPDDNYGGAGADTICSGPGSDSNEGAGGNDLMDWGSGTSDVNEGGPGYDECNTTTTCEGSWSTSPCTP